MHRSLCLSALVLANDDPQQRAGWSTSGSTVWFGFFPEHKRNCKCTVRVRVCVGACKQSPASPVTGLCGGSASGKTTVARKIIEALDVPWVVLLSMDSFYKVCARQSACGFDSHLFACNQTTIQKRVANRVSRVTAMSTGLRTSRNEDEHFWTRKLKV